jgi:hypothetical protein
MLAERGLDRACDLLLTGYLASFFALDKDSSTYSANVLKSLRGIAQEDLPTSKLGDTSGARLSGDTITEPNADYDYSDMDKDESYDPLTATTE